MARRQAKAATVPAKTRTSVPTRNARPSAAPATGNPRLDTYLDTIEYTSGDTTTDDIDSAVLHRLANDLDLTPDYLAITRSHQPEDQQNLSHSGTR